MRAADFPLDLYRGDTYRWAFALWHDINRTQPVDLTDSRADAEIRYESGGLEIMTLGCSITLPNTVDVVLDADMWLEFPVKRKPMYWDLQVTFPDASVFTYIRGNVTTTLDITDSTVMPASAAMFEGRTERWLTSR